MIVLIGIALKSILVAALTLAILGLLHKRSAAERSLISHTGLVALIVMAFAPMALPRLTIDAPVRLISAPGVLDVSKDQPVSISAIQSTASSKPAIPVTTRLASERMRAIDAGSIAAAVYAIPAVALLILTLLALGRLFALRARADVLVDTRWLSALARAQRRMGFKHGTALLTSDELSSPVSWGLIRPVILLNTRAVQAAGEAEAIIAHELAHVARMDWMKLLLARLATALFWFNPFVWLLAREAHQLREEAADDTVLAADILDTDYAQLLVGVARHECPGLLLGAHGVAPSKNSLSRRVARVLDGKSVRGPVAWSFALSAAAAALAIAAPLAALTLGPARDRAVAKTVEKPTPGLSTRTEASASDLPTDLPRIIVRGVSTSLNTASAAIVASSSTSASLKEPLEPTAGDMTLPNRKLAARSTDRVRAIAHGATSLRTADMIAAAANGTVAGADAELRDGRTRRSGTGGRERDDAIGLAIQMKSLGITADYVNAIRAASPALRDATLNEIVAMRAVGASPDYVRALTAAGLGNVRAADIEQARAVGLSPEFIRDFRRVDPAIRVSDLVELRAMGITADEFARARAAGSLDQRRVRRVHGAQPPEPPRPPQPPSGDSGG